MEEQIAPVNYVWLWFVCVALSRTIIQAVMDVHITHRQVKGSPFIMFISTYTRHLLSLLSFLSPSLLQAHSYYSPQTSSPLLLFVFFLECCPTLFFSIYFFNFIFFFSQEDSPTDLFLPIKNINLKNTPATYSLLYSTFFSCFFLIMFPITFLHYFSVTILWSICTLMCMQ